MKSVLTVLALCALLSLVLSASIIDLEDEKQPLGTRKHKFVPYPKKIVGLYILLADEEKEGHENNATKWTPELYEWQQQAANVLFITFIKPDDEFIVPKSFKDLAATRGTGAGNSKASGENLVHFVKKLKSLQPNMIVNQPVYGYPQVTAESYVVNHSWDEERNNLGIANSIGLMVYEGTSSLNFVKNYANGTDQWEGFPIKVRVEPDKIQLGCKGGSSAGTITTLANAAVEQNLQGIMVWYASVVNGFRYAEIYDASTHEESTKAYVEARKILDP